jgi:hypothetical protein
LARPSIPPPPTRFGQLSMQPKAAITRKGVPPPTQFGPTPAQLKTGALVSFRARAIQPAARSVPPQSPTEEEKTAPGATASAVPAAAVAAAPATWQKVGKTQWDNCTAFAFSGRGAYLENVPDLAKLLELATGSGGFVETSNLGEATIVLYGHGRQYSHAIRRLGRFWFEVYGNDFNRYTGGSMPPPTHHGNRIVAVLKPARL